MNGLHASFRRGSLIADPSILRVLFSIISRSVSFALGSTYSLITHPSPSSISECLLVAMINTSFVFFSLLSRAFIIISVCVVLYFFPGAEMEADLLEQQREEAANAAEQHKEKLAQRDGAVDDDGDDDGDDDDGQQEEQNSLTMGRGIMPSSSAKDLMLGLKPCKSMKHKSSQQQVSSALSTSRTSSSSSNCSNSSSSSSSASSGVSGGVAQQEQRTSSTASAFSTAEAAAKNVAADSKLSLPSPSSTDRGRVSTPADTAPLPTATPAAAVVPHSPRGFPPKPPVAGGGDLSVHVEESAAVPAAPAVPKRVPVTDPAGSLITAEPEMLACTLTAEDEFVVLACDGLFDVFSSEEVRVLLLL